MDVIKYVVDIPEPLYNNLLLVSAKQKIKLYTLLLKYIKIGMLLDDNDNVGLYIKNSDDKLEAIQVK